MPLLTAETTSPTEPAREPVWHTPGPASELDLADPESTATSVEVTSRRPTTSPPEYLWRLPELRTHQSRSAPAPSPVAPNSDESPELSARTPTPLWGPALASRLAETNPLPTLHARAPSPAHDLSRIVDQVVRQVRTELTRTVVEEVQRTTAKLAPAHPQPRPADVLEMLYTDQSIRKLLARIQRVELEERRRGGVI